MLCFFEIMLIKINSVILVYSSGVKPLRANHSAMLVVHIINIVPMIAAIGERWRMAMTFLCGMLLSFPEVALSFGRFFLFD